MIISVKQGPAPPGPSVDAGDTLLGEGQGEDTQTVFGSGHWSSWVKMGEAGRTPWLRLSLSVDLPDAFTFTLPSKEAAITTEVRLCTLHQRRRTRTRLRRLVKRPRAQNGDNMSGLATLVVMAALLGASSFAIGMLPLFFVFSS